MNARQISDLHASLVVIKAEVEKIEALIATEPSVNKEVSEILSMTFREFVTWIGGKKACPHNRIIYMLENPTSKLFTGLRT